MKLRINPTQRKEWTDEMDAMIVHHRLPGAFYLIWHDLSIKMGIPVSTLRKRADILFRAKEGAANDNKTDRRELLSYEVLPTGHHISWESITNNTVLHGARYPQNLSYG